MPGDLTFDWVTLARAIDAGVEDLLIRHWEEIALNQDDTPLAPNWGAYRILEQSGVLRMVAARRAGVLVGYNIFTAQPPLHYNTSFWAVNDVLYLDPAERHGMAGARMIRASEPMLKALGVQRVFYHTKIHVHLGQGKARGTVGNLLMKLGYAHVEDVFAKTL